MSTATRKTPQDRKPKASHAFTFDADGKTWALAPPSAALEQIPGRVFRDAMLDGEVGEIKFGLTCVEHVGADAETLAALYSLPTVEMLHVIGQWMSSADLSGATLPQS